MLKNRSSNEKAGIYIIIFMILLLVVVLLIYFLFGKNPPSSNIIVDNNVMFQYSKKKWKIVDSNDYNKYNWDKYTIYEQGNKKGIYSVYSRDSKFYVFLENNNTREPINIVGDSIYLGGKINTDYYSFKKKDLTSSDIDYVSKVLSKYDISSKEQDKYTFRYKIVFDFDNDKDDEEMFIVSNLFNENTNVLNSFSFIFIRDNNDTKIIYNNIYGDNSNLSGCFAYLLGIVKIDGSNSYQLITKCSHYSVIDDEYGLYQYKNNGYELLLYSK